MMKEIDHTFVRSHVVQVGTSAEQAVNPSHGRHSLSIFNSGGTVVHLDTTEQVSSARGITLQPDGSVNLTEAWDYALVRAAWSAVSDSAGGQITVYETVDRTVYGERV